MHLNAYFSDHPGWAEHDPLVIGRYCQACQRLWADNHIPKSAIKGVAVTTQRGTMINLDKHGNPLRPAIVCSISAKGAGGAADQMVVARCIQAGARG